MNSCLYESCETCPAKVVCRCLQVTEEQIVRLITHLELRTVKEIKQLTGAGDGCTCCHNDLRQYLERHGCVEAGV